jgi:hypothetical protein
MSKYGGFSDWVIAPLNEREQRVEKIKKNDIGRKPVSESQWREKNVIRSYVSDEELKEVRAFVGDRSTSDIIRTLVLNAARKAKLNYNSFYNNG